MLLVSVRGICVVVGGGMACLTACGGKGFPTDLNSGTRSMAVPPGSSRSDSAGVESRVRKRTRRTDRTKKHSQCDSPMDRLVENVISALLIVDAPSPDQRWVGRLANCLLAI